MCSARVEKIPCAGVDVLVPAQRVIDDSKSNPDLFLHSEDDLVVRLPTEELVDLSLQLETHSLETAGIAVCERHRVRCGHGIVGGSVVSRGEVGWFFFFLFVQCLPVGFGGAPTWRSLANGGVVVRSLVHRPEKKPSRWKGDIGRKSKYTAAQ